jgi:multicomponent Na+:H+ antiporter subunit G
MTSQIFYLLSWTLLLLGGIFSIIGGIGLIRLPDFYSRMHASSITDTLAMFLIIAGLMLQGGLSLVTLKLFLIFVFIFLTAPVSTHALANAAYKGRKESPITINNLLMSNQKKGAKLANTPDVLPDIISPNFTDEDSAANNKSAKYRNRGESK